MKTFGDEPLGRLAQAAHPTSLSEARRCVRRSHRLGWDLLRRSVPCTSSPSSVVVPPSAKSSRPFRIHQSELMIGAADTPVIVHLASQSPKAEKSCQLASACWKWSATPASVS